MRKLFLVPVIVFSLAVLPKPAEAVPIVGILDLSGAVAVTLGGLIDWQPPVGGGVGLIDIENTSTGYFAVLGGFQATELDLTAAAFPAGPPGTFAPLPGFETFAGTPLPGLNFTLTAILPCFTGCGFGFTPHFSVLFNGVSTTVLMDMQGFVTDSNNPGEVATWIGQWSAQFPGQSPVQVITDLINNGQIETSFSASKVSVAQVPEPAALLMFGMGTLFLTLRRRRSTAS